MSLHFHQLLRKKLQKVSHFVRKHEKSSIWPNLCNFSNKLPCLYISMNFSEKVAKSASFREKARKTIDLAKTCNFSSKLPCLGIFMNFSARRCKKCLISWKSTRNHRFRQHYATFRTNYHVFAFRWTFKEKVGKRCSFGEKARKIMDLVKTCNFWNKLPCFYVSENFSANSCKNWLISWESTKTHRCSQNYATFSNKLPCFGFSINFWAKGGSIREKARKIIFLAKTLQLLEQTTMSLHFDQLFRKKLQKVPHFVKKHVESSIWPKLCNFSNKLLCLCISMNFSGKSCKKCVVSWKSTKNHRFCQHATFRENYHVLTFRWTLQQKVAKRCSCREKARKIINLAKSLQLFEQTSMFLHFDEFSRKKLPKVLRFVKKNEKSSIWPKLCNFSRKLPCFGISMKFSAKSYKKCLISWKSTKNRRFGENSQLFQQTTMFLHFDEFSRKKLPKVLRFVKKHEHPSIWPKLATSRRNYHVLAFRLLLQEKVAKRWKKWLIS